MRIIISGSRDITDLAVLEQAIEESGFEITEIIEGGQRTYDESGTPIGGIDFLANCYGKQRGIPVITEAAEWQKLGRSAGPIRNKKMITKYKPEGLIAVPKGLSRGTRGMIRLAKRYGLQTFVFEG